MIMMIKITHLPIDLLTNILSRLPAETVVLFARI
ncbi:hypothetical protein KSS87_004629 [Heliosperma pusillum]|nr:hypothetical protein KSS87_004629 [Heliosperma pusillum]